MNSHHLLCWARALALACLIAVSARVQAQPAPGPAAEGLEQLARTHRICAMAVAVLKDRRVQSVQAAQGCADAAPVGPDTVFQAASLGKPLFAYAVLKLVQQGRLDLDAPLAGYLPQGYQHQHRPFVDAPGTGPADLLAAPEWKQITARHVLTHTSGLPNWARGELNFAFAPGAAWRYSGEGFVLLQRVVEAITGQALETWMQGQVFQPLGMTSSSYRWSAALQGRLAPGTASSGQPVPDFRFQQPLAAATLYTTAGDYARFVAALLSDQTLLRQTLEAPVQAHAALGLQWGLGWGVEQADAGLHIWHWGNNTGYRAFVMASVRSGDGVVMLSNSEDGLLAVEPLLGQVLPGGHPVLAFPMLGLPRSGFWCRVLGLCG